MANWTIEENGVGRRAGILIGLVPAIAIVIFWWVVSSHSLVSFCLALFIAGNVVGFGSYGGRYKDTNTRLETQATSTDETQATKKTKPYQLYGVIPFSILGLIVGVYGAATHAAVMSQFNALPLWLFWTLYIVTATTVLTSFGSRIVDIDSRPPRIQKGIKWGIGIGVSVCLIACGVSWFGYGHTNPLSLLALISANTHGTSGLLFGPMGGSIHGTILGIISFAVVGASFGEAVAKTISWCKEYGSPEHQKYAQLGKQGRKQWLENSSNYHNDPDKKATIANYYDFLGSIIGWPVGAGIGAIIAYRYAVDINTFPGMAICGLEVIIASLVGSALTSRLFSVFGDGWFWEPEGNNTETETLWENPQVVRSSSSLSSLPAAVRRPSQTFSTSPSSDDSPPPPPKGGSEKTPILPHQPPLAPRLNSR